jgi:hypothetical protein
LPGSLAPRNRASLARPACASKRGLLAGWARRETRLRSGLRSSNQNPLGNCVGAQVETSCGPDSACVRFLIAACRSAPGSCELTGHDSGSEELVISACHHRLRGLEGAVAPAVTVLSPVARDYPSRALEGFFRSPRCDC